MKQPLTIEFFGQTYRFESEYDLAQAEAVRDLLVYEIEKVESHHQGQHHKVSKIAILISAALSLANENFELKKYKAEFSKEVYTRYQSLLDRLNSL